MTPQFDILSRSDGATIAYNKLDGASPGVVFLHGLDSDRNGTKAQALEAHCQNIGRAFVTFDMFGHGDSSGNFSDGGISRWTDDALAVLDELTTGPQVLVGSSMGGWVMVRAALARPERIAGLVGIAAAPDFTEDLMWDQFSDTEKQTLAENGRLEQPSDYDDEPYVISAHLIEDGRTCLVLRDEIAYSGPVRLLQGQKDTDVPPETALRLSEHLSSEDVETILIKDGDHRLSRPQDLRRLLAILDSLCHAVGRST